VRTPEDAALIQELRGRLEEAEETLRAIQGGEIDALVVQGEGGERVFTLQGADHPYRTLIEAMQQGAASLSAEGTVLYCNRRFAEMVKRPHEKVIGASVSDFLAAGCGEPFRDLLRQGLTHNSNGELRFRAADGTQLPVRLSLNRLPLTEAVTLCLVATDLTEQKEHLDLQEASRRKDEFLAMLAHELRNPLAPIRNGLQVMRMAGTDGALVERMRDMMDRQLTQLVRLVDDLLDVSRITRGKIELRKERVCLAAVIESALETSHPLVEAAKHRLSVDLPPDPLAVTGDFTRLAQVVSNLLNNSAKYTPEGGRVWVSAAREGDRAAIRVRDDGTGISADMLPTVFDLFTQVDRTIDRAQGGLGIGLTLVRRLVEMHGGSVEARSDGAGRGSEFVVRLPLASGEAAPEPPPPSTAAGSKVLRVLVVDDNRDSADSLAMLLELLGHETRVANDGPGALRAAEEFGPEVVFLDIGLPGMDGYEVARRLRLDPHRRGLILAAMTGWGQEEDRRRSREAGFDQHLVKPVSPEAIQAVLAAGAARG
jgi:PAS domain S-box-containing protein